MGSPFISPSSFSSPLKSNTLHNRNLTHPLPVHHSLQAEQHLEDVPVEDASQQQRNRRSRRRIERGGAAAEEPSSQPNRAVAVVAASSARPDTTSDVRGGKSDQQQRQEPNGCPSHPRSASKGKQQQQGMPLSSPGVKMRDILANHLSCAICQDWLVACHALSCGHMFCGLCLATWLSRSQSCPHCRKPVSGELRTTL